MQCFRFEMRHFEQTPEWTGHHRSTAVAPYAHCLPLRGSVRLAMQRSPVGRIKLSRANWELPALVSLLMAVIASLYAATPEFHAWIAAARFFFSLMFGLASIAKQIAASRARIVYFTKEDWRPRGNKLALEIESSFLLFRVETLKPGGFYQEVTGSTETRKDGRLTRVLFSSGIPDEYLSGRIVIR